MRKKEKVRRKKTPLAHIFWLPDYILPFFTWPNRKKKKKKNREREKKTLHFEDATRWKFWYTVVVVLDAS
jgi:hypothetical protein